MTEDFVLSSRILKSEVIAMATLKATLMFSTWQKSPTVSDLTNDNTIQYRTTIPYYVNITKAL